MLFLSKFFKKPLKVTAPPIAVRPQTAIVGLEIEYLKSGRTNVYCVTSNIKGEDSNILMEKISQAKRNYSQIIHRISVDLNQESITYLEVAEGLIIKKSDFISAKVIVKYN
jgi:hypothetical protein